jgi:hypothetical protein
MAAFTKRQERKESKEKRYVLFFFVEALVLPSVLLKASKSTSVVDKF